MEVKELDYNVDDPVMRVNLEIIQATLSTIIEILEDMEERIKALEGGP